MACLIPTALRSRAFRLVVATAFAGLASMLYLALGRAESGAHRPNTATPVLAMGRGAPFMHLSDGRPVTTTFVGATELAAKLGDGLASPLALASADLDEDGVPDLICGHADGEHGFVSIQRGNVDALWPYGEALRNGKPQPFLPDARVFATSAAPDFLVAGDFDADGHWDIAVARRGDNALYFSRGDGRGFLGVPERIELPGGVTVMDAGDVNRRDGLTDIVVGIANQSGAQLLVFEGPNGALRNEPEEFELSRPATALSFAPLTGNVRSDIAVAEGRVLTIIQARDRRLSETPEVRNAVPPAKVTHQSLSFNVESLAAGELKTGVGFLAALGDDRKIHFLALPAFKVNTAEPQLLAVSNTSQSLAGPTSSAARLPVPPEERRTKFVPAAADGQLDLIGELALAGSVGGPNASIVSAHISAGSASDLVVIDAGSRQLHVVNETANQHTMQLATKASGIVGSLGIAASLDAAAGAPVAVLPMRLSPSPLDHLVVLQTGMSAASVVEPLAVATFTVTNTNDSGAGSLRQAILDSNVTAGETQIVFNIPEADPGRDPATGAFIFKPLPGTHSNLYHDLLPGLQGDVVTLDGYTQPGAHPNTLVNGDNAVIRIRIDGVHSLNGSIGLRLSFADANTVRGVAITNYTKIIVNPDDDTWSGAWGMYFSSRYGFVEGSFLGTDETGTRVIPNRCGIMLDGAGLIPRSNETVGGTTPQARNLISGNTYMNVGVFPDGVFSVTQGNFIGTDIAGMNALDNPGDGFGSDSTELTVGGTVAGARNVISGNKNINVDLNDYFAYGIVEDSLIQGNWIGTNATGTAAIPESYTGVGIVDGPQRNTIGGTTPGARNVISGNVNHGVTLGSLTEEILVQGNYIGLDPTGAAAIANGSGIFIGISNPDHPWPAATNTIGGAVPGSGNVISKNTGDGIVISGSYASKGNVVQGNLIGTGPDGTTPRANGTNGIRVESGAVNNAIGGLQNGTGNLIAFNADDGVRVDASNSNPIRGNVIVSNAATGVRIVSGKYNAIGRNAIYGNGALGVDNDVAGSNASNPCNTNTSGANELINAPVLTAGGGGTLVTATATDPWSNTSELSNCVAATVAGSMASLTGTFEGRANTNYTIEFFKNDTCDESGCGEGQTFLCATTVRTGPDCKASITGACDVAKADVGVVFGGGGTYSYPYRDFPYTAVVTNNGAINASNVTLSNTVPANMAAVSVTTTQGECDVTGNLVTCALGGLTTGLSATVKIVGKPLTVDNTASTANVTASEPDPNAANNSATVTSEGRYFSGCPESFEPAYVFAGSPDLDLLIKGGGIVPVTTVTFKGTALPTTFVDGLQCALAGNFYPCQGVRVAVPASLLTTPGNAQVTGTNPPPGGGSCSMNFRILAPIPTPTPTATATPTAGTPATATRTPTPTGPMPTRTPVPERCYDCIDNDFDALVDRDDDDCPARANGAMLGLSLPTREAKGIAKCGKTLGQAGMKFSAAKLKHLQKCVNAAFVCVQQKPGDERCVAKLASTCAKELGKSASDEGKLRAAIVKACGLGATEMADLRSVAGVGYEMEVPVCQERGVGALESASDIADCVVAQHGCRVWDLLASEVPRAAELLRLAGRDPAAEFPCLPAGADGAGGELGARKGRLAVSCQKAIAKAGAKFASVTEKLTHDCLRAVYACVQVKPADPKCLPKAVASCEKKRDRLDAPAKGAAAKLTAAIAKSCAKDPLVLADLLEDAGLGFGSLADECLAFGVPSLDSVGSVSACLERRHACRIEQMLETEMPRLVELLSCVPW